jgi:hypothetical protein
MTMPDWATLIGFLGTACIIAAYAYLTFNPVPNAMVLHATNLAGAALLAISLMVHMNLPSLVLEGFWAAIALFGLGKAFKARQQGQQS